MWQNEIVRIVRHLIDDLDGSTYSDSRLEESVIVSAQMLFSKISLSTTYTIDVDELTLTPDPTTSSPKDDDFINLLSVQTAVNILRSELKTTAAQAYRIVDGPSSVDVSQVYKAKKELYDDMKKDLEQAIFSYQTGNGSGGLAILTPYTTANAYTGDYYNGRRCYS